MKTSSARTIRLPCRSMLADDSITPTHHGGRRAAPRPRHRRRQRPPAHLPRHARGARLPCPGGGICRRGASRLRREDAGRGPARSQAPRRDGTRRAAGAAAALPRDPGGGGLGLRQRAGRGGGDAARRLGVPGEAGREGTPLRRPRPGARARATQRRASRWARGGRGPVRDGGALGGHAARLPARGHGGSHAGARDDLGRPRHRQGAGGPRDPRPVAPTRSAVRADELRGGAGGAGRERDVRPREGGLHRGGARTGGGRSRAPTAARCSWTRSAT